MFSKQTENVIETSECCFVILKKSHWTYFDDNRATLNAENDFLNHPLQDRFIYKLLSNKATRESYFEFTDTLPATPQDFLLPKGVSKQGDSDRDFVLNNCRSCTRLSAEFAMTVDGLHKVCDSSFSTWNGKKFPNPAALKEAKNILKIALIKTHIDVQDEITKNWNRIEKLRPKKQKEKKSQSMCRIS